MRRTLKEIEAHRRASLRRRIARAIVDTLAITAMGALAVVVLTRIAGIAWSAEPDVNPNVTPSTLRTTICRPGGGYAESIRPSEKWSEALKRRLLPPGHRLGEYQLDHVIPLCAGGAPYSLSNLRLQPIGEAHEKDEDERRMCILVCAGMVPLGEAQTYFREWTPDRLKYFRGNRSPRRPPPDFEPIPHGDDDERG